MNNNILLVYGGNSVEHEISIITALQIKNKYKGKYNLILCYLKDGNFYISKKLEKIDFYKSSNFNKKALHKVNFIANKNYIKYNFKMLPFEAVWLVVHGSNCEDGTLYSYFKTLNINVISENITSAVIGQNKSLSKKCCDVSVLPFFEITQYDYNFNLESVVVNAKNIGFPAIIKPINLGSSVGISSINNIEELVAKLDELLHLSSSVIVEKKLETFTELNIAAFFYKDRLILSNIEKVSNNKVLSYSDKYVNNEKSMSGQQKELPANISDDLKIRLQEMAKNVYFNLKAQYIVRMDFLYDDANDQLYFNEINNIPGSLALYLFDIDSSELIDMYLDEGLKNSMQENQMITSYQENIFNQPFFNNVKLNK